MNGRNRSPNPNPTPLPNTFASLKYSMIITTKFTQGTNIRRNSHPQPNVMSN